MDLNADLKGIWGRGGSKHCRAHQMACTNLAEHSRWCSCRRRRRCRQSGLPLCLQHYAQRRQEPALLPASVSSATWNPAWRPSSTLARTQWSVATPHTYRAYTCCSRSHSASPDAKRGVWNAAASLLPAALVSKAVRVARTRAFLPARQAFCECDRSLFAHAVHAAMLCVASPVLCAPMSWKALRHSSLGAVPLRTLWQTWLTSNPSAAMRLRPRAQVGVYRDGQAARQACVDGLDHAPADLSVQQKINCAVCKGKQRQAARSVRGRPGGCKHNALNPTCKLGSWGAAHTVRREQPHLNLPAANGHAY